MLCRSRMCLELWNVGVQFCLGKRVEIATKGGVFCSDGWWKTPNKSNPHGPGQAHQLQDMQGFISMSMLPQDVVEDHADLRLSRSS